MQSDLVDLRITAKELEQLTGFEVNDLFIGGMIGGTYRGSVFSQPKRIIALGLTQLFVLALMVIFALPFGLLIIRNDSHSITDVPTISRFLEITLGISISAVVIWNGSMVLKLKQLRPLAHLLDEVDKYNDVVSAIAVVDRLDAISITTSHVLNRRQAIEALAITRNSLICGLMTEKILRQNRTLLARRSDLMASIEQNLATLQTLEVNNQANEYVELLNEAMQIGLSVHQEMQQITQR